MGETFADDDVEKTVENANGEVVGTVETIEGDTAHVEPRGGIVDSIRATLGWGQSHERTVAIRESDVDEISSETIRIETESVAPLEGTESDETGPEPAKDDPGGGRGEDSIEATQRGDPDEANDSTDTTDWAGESSGEGESADGPGSTEELDGGVDIEAAAEATDTGESGSEANESTADVRPETALDPDVDEHSSAEQASRPETELATDEGGDGSEPDPDTPATRGGATWPEADATSTREDPVDDTALEHPTAAGEPSDEERVTAGPDATGTAERTRSDTGTPGVDESAVERDRRSESEPGHDAHASRGAATRPESGAISRGNASIDATSLERPPDPAESMADERRAPESIADERRASGADSSTPATRGAATRPEGDAVSPREDPVDTASIGYPPAADEERVTAGRVASDPDAGGDGGDRTRSGSPLAAAFATQQAAVTVSQKLLEQGFAAQQRGARSAVETPLALQRQGLESVQTATRRYFDAVTVTKSSGSPDRQQPTDANDGRTDR